MNLLKSTLTKMQNRPAAWTGLTLAIVFSAAILSVPAVVFAGGGPENVVVVVNADSASSKMLANYYIHGRNIPARNVIYLNNIPDREIAGWKIARERILQPLIAEIERRQLYGNVDYIVYSSDFPTVVEVLAHQKKLVERLKESPGQNLPATVFNANASLTSLTYFAGAALADEPAYMLLDSNNYYRKRAEILLRQPFIGDQQELFEGAVKKINSDSDEDLDDAIKTLMEIGKKNPQQLALLYWLAKFHAKKGNAKQATEWLIRSVKLGWCYRQQTLADLAFEKVKDDPMFKGIVSRIPDLPFEFVPTYGFKNRFSWGPNGMLNAEQGQGNRHMLSSILSVTRNQGISEKDALRQIQLSMLADESHPEGTFYFTETKDVRSTTRQPNFPAAIEQLKAMGFNAEIVPRALPAKARDIIGLSSGVATFNWIASGSKIIPGAFCDNLTSYGGAFHRKGQTKCIQFLANGAAGASGTVVEPYAIQAKFPHPMIHVHYARGCSMAESFYQSVEGPFQTLLVGDALCQPWATKPILKINGMAAGDTLKGQIELTMDSSDSPVPIGIVEFYVDGRPVHRIGLQDSIKLDTSDMTDGYHEIRLVATANNTIQTTGSIVVPVAVNNRGDSTTLTTEHANYVDTDQITFEAKSTTGDSIELMHNGRPLAKKIGKQATFIVPANLLGRGPVKVTAVAITESGATVASMPLEFEIEGRIGELVRETEPKPKKKPAPPKKK